MNQPAAAFRVFSYGTLRQANVQLALYGRQVPTTDDALPGWRIEWLKITDPVVIETSGSDQHPILVPGQHTDSVTGAVLELTEAELSITDRYEVADYARQLVSLTSGLEAFVYVAQVLK